MENGHHKIPESKPADLGLRPRAVPVVNRTERCVTAALVWLANHQAADGSWSLKDYNRRCFDNTCTGQSTISSDAGATALGLLPFLAAGQTHKSKGPYKEYIRKGVEWLIRHQQPDGNLAKGSTQMMYGHGLATIALSETYGLSGDKQVGMAAQGAVNFILNAQNTADGGWRYNPKDPGDTSVLGWQLTALKSAKVAGLNVGGAVFSGASRYLDSVAVNDGAEYGYQPGVGSSNTMTAVGLLGRQYLGVKRDSPMLTGGVKYLMNNLPDENFPNIYYWYYATQVMHNMSGFEWDTWNKKIRDILSRTQIRDTNSCANGSWDPAKDAWGKLGGRVMATSLSTLTVETYSSRNPWIFNLDSANGNSVSDGVAKPKGNGDGKPGKNAGDNPFGAPEKPKKLPVNPVNPFGPTQPNPDPAPPRDLKKPANPADDNNPFG
jgi:hypothetical protein